MQTVQPRRTRLLPVAAVVLAVVLAVAGLVVAAVQMYRFLTDLIEVVIAVLVFGATGASG